MAGSLLMRLADWLFRDRNTGHFVVAQWPNLPLWLFGAASLVAGVAGQTTRLGFGALVVAGVALAVWAGDEMLRGVNPWRRGLGAAVLIAEAVRVLG